MVVCHDPPPPSKTCDWGTPSCFTKASKLETQFKFIYSYRMHYEPQHPSHSHENTTRAVVRIKLMPPQHQLGILHYTCKIYVAYLNSLLTSIPGGGGIETVVVWIGMTWIVVGCWRLVTTAKNTQKIANIRTINENFKIGNCLYIRGLNENHSQNKPWLDIVSWLSNQNGDDT